MGRIELAANFAADVLVLQRAGPDRPLGHGSVGVLDQAAETSGGEG